MATYLKLRLSNQQNYVEIKLSHPEETYNTTAAAAGGDLDIICCVDVSGSMSGSPINNVCEVLRDIYQRTQKDYRLFTYNTQTDVKRTLKTLSERNDNLQASGGTSFACIFTAIKDYLLQNASAKKPITFIFMTDGQDNEPNGPALQKSVQMLKLMLSGMTNSPPITFHVIGFGEVNDAFLNQIRTFGTRQGLFRYSTESKELQNNFNDMFEYALNVRQFTIKFPNGKTYTANNIDNETVGFLTNDGDDLSAMAELTLIDDKTTTTQFPLAPMKDIRAIHLLHALNLIQPENEEQVKSIQTYLNDIQITNSKNFAERLETEQIYKEIDQRMMEYRQLFTQLKMTQVPERVKLQLSALRHDPIFANTQRKKKLDLRVYKNVDYFKKTNISGILQGYKDSITSDTWQKIQEQKQNWVDTYSKEDIYEIMRKSSDNILCLGIFVQRDEEVINNPAKGLKLLKVTNTIISYDSFINGMNLAKNNQQVQGQFTTLNDLYSIAGALADEQINAVIPLYINDEHMKRIRILEGIWLGYLYTLDSYGYDKQQEVALLKLLYEIIQQRTNTQRQKQHGKYITVDGGPDENSRFPKTLVAAIRKFRKYNLDTLFVLTHAPGQSAYNIVERRTAPLSDDLAGLILPHDHFSTHLNDSAEVWCGSVIDEYPAVAEYIDSPASTLDKLRLIEVNLIMNDILDRVCEEEAEEPIEHQVGQSDEYCQERVRPPHITTDGELLRDEPKYDIDEYWCATHVLQTQYTIQIVRCNSISCCGLRHSNYIQVFPHRFLSAPVAFERTPRGIAMAECDYQKGVFYGSLIQRIQFHSVVMQHTQNDILPFDYYCSSVRKELKRHICSIRKQYI
ncbi:unnamed protein product [Rotaria sp. Silwood2]|nr:unnamed protein product [Rotaria sp. Silwood2]